MMRLARTFRTLRHDRRGATLMEFALVVVPFMLILMGIFDFAYRGYVGSIVEGTVNRAARLATVGNMTTTQIDDYVKNELRHFSPSATITSARASAMRPRRFLLWMPVITCHPLRRTARILTWQTGPA